MISSIVLLILIIVLFLSLLTLFIIVLTKKTPQPPEIEIPEIKIPKITFLRMTNPTSQDVPNNAVNFYLEYTNVQENTMDNAINYADHKKFIINTPGIYFISFSLHWDGNAADGARQSYIEIIKNGVLIHAALNMGPQSKVSGIGQNGSTMQELNSDDTFSIKVGQSNASNYTIPITNTDIVIAKLS
jgi:hypothetical protein